MINYSKNNQTSINKGVLYFDDVKYPEKLKSVLNKQAPKELYYLGNLDIINKKGIGFCGSRNASSKGLSAAIDCAEQIVENDATVVSGYANGVDITAHYTALKFGGTTIIVLPEGIDKFRVKKEIQEVWDWERVLIISQFKPDDIWQAYRAMNRNQVIIALSDAMIVIEAQDKGGTIEAGKSTIKLKMPLFVVEYEHMLDSIGNRILLQMGAKSLKKSKASGRANIRSVLDKTEQFSYNTNQATQSQLSFI